MLAVLAIIGSPAPLVANNEAPKVIEVHEGALNYPAALPEPSDRVGATRSSHARQLPNEALHLSRVLAPLSLTRPLQAARRAIESADGDSGDDVAAALAIHPFMLSKWRKDVRDGGIRARTGSAGRGRSASFSRSVDTAATIDHLGFQGRWHANFAGPTVLRPNQGSRKLIQRARGRPSPFAWTARRGDRSLSMVPGVRCRRRPSGGDTRRARILIRLPLGSRVGWHPS